MREHQNKRNIRQIAEMIAALAILLLFPVQSPAAEQSSQIKAETVTEEFRILEIPGSDGKYISKSDGFYCLHEDGTKDGQKAVHYFDHFTIDGTVFDGYYYHDESGKFTAGNAHMVFLENLSVQVEIGEKYSYTVLFDGYYMAGNLGKLSAAPQVRYIDHLEINGKIFDGYYYFNQHGKMVTEPGIHYVNMDSNGKHFEGYYYFGGSDGSLIQCKLDMSEGVSVEEDGSIKDWKTIKTDMLTEELNTMLLDYEGEWSIYIKNLDNQEEILINNRSISSASLIKVFALAGAFDRRKTVEENEASRMQTTTDNPSVSEKLDQLFWNMITISDNESFNELVRLQTETYSFSDGANVLNEYLEAEGYTDTMVCHTLSPSSSKEEGIGESNLTSVKDCGLLLERIYRGKCVSKAASEQMLGLLLNQKSTWKIPEGLSSNVTVANKTGETSDSQHDMAIVYGENTTYILCIMSVNCPEDNAISYIQSISAKVYNFLNTCE